MKLVGRHLVEKLVREKDSQGAQLLRGLSVLCECQGAPVEQNQSKFHSAAGVGLVHIAIVHVYN